MDAQGTFRRRLRHIKRTWQLGLAARDLVRLAGGAIAAVAALGLLDYFLAFDDVLRPILLACLCGAAAVAAALWIGRVLVLRDLAAARRADALSGSRRRPAQGALELCGGLRSKTEAPSDMQSYLIGRAIDNATAELERLPLRTALPRAELGRQARVFVLQALVAGLLYALNPAACRVIAARLFEPFRDIPPYSTLAFRVSPEAPRVIYGGAIEVGCEVAGAPEGEPVLCLTRARSQVHRGTCFQDNGRRYTQRLERVVAPVEFCFACGKARSRWFTVDVLLQPEIAGASALVTPPDYTGLPAKRIVPGREELAGYRRSRVELRVTSNRPLKDGAVLISPRDDPANVQVVPGVPVGVETVAFEWALGGDASLEVSVRDVRGTTNRAPWRLQQKLIPDEPPVAGLAEPPPFSLATTAAVVRVSGNVSDDLGLRKTDLVRTLVGFRDRSLALPVEMGDRSFDFEHPMELATLGVKPGQVLEFFVEASDGNPDLTGVTVSDVVRVQIISDEEYSMLMRARLALDDFANRFDAAKDSMEELVKALESLLKAAEAHNPVDLDARREDALRTNRRISGLLEKIAKDFPVFDLDQKLTTGVTEALQTLRKQAGQLAAKEFAVEGDAVAKVQAMIQELGGATRDIEKAAGQAQAVEALGRVMEMAAEFRDLVNRQGELVRRLERMNAESGNRDTALLTELARRQRDLEERVRQFSPELRRRAVALPAGFAQVQQSAVEFADALETLGVSGLMKDAALAADNRDGRETQRLATLALDKLKELLGKGDGGKKGEPGNRGQGDGGEGEGEGSPGGRGLFAGMCRGQGSFDAAGDLRSTLQQMLSAILQRHCGNSTGQGPAMAGGGVIGGDINDGYAVGGFSSLNVPVTGPERAAYAAQAVGMSMGEQGHGKGGERAKPGSEVKKETLPANESAKLRGERLQMEQVPEKYREAVKRYFGAGGAGQ